MSSLSIEFKRHAGASLPATMQTQSIGAEKLDDDRLQRSLVESGLLAPELATLSLPEMRRLREQEEFKQSQDALLFILRNQALLDSIHEDFDAIEGDLKNLRHNVTRLHDMRSHFHDLKSHMILDENGHIDWAESGRAYGLLDHGFAGTSDEARARIAREVLNPDGTIKAAFKGVVPAEMVELAHDYKHLQRDNAALHESMQDKFTAVKEKIDQLPDGDDKREAQKRLDDLKEQKRQLHHEVDAELEHENAELFQDDDKATRNDTKPLPGPTLAAPKI